MTVACVLHVAYRRAIVCLLLLCILPFRAQAQEVDTNQVNDYLSKIWPMHFRDIDSALNRWLESIPSHRTSLIQDIDLLK